MARSRARSNWRRTASRRSAAHLALMPVLLLILTGCTVHLLPQPTPTPVLLGGIFQYQVPTATPSPQGITAGPDGAGAR